MDKYCIYGKCFLGGGYLSIKNDKRFWSREAQEFTKEELDAILPKIGPEWTIRVYNAETKETVMTRESKHVFVPTGW